jgi:hypothetical protein
MTKKVLPIHAVESDENVILPISAGAGDSPATAIHKIKKPSFSEKFKSKNAPTLSGVETLLTTLPILKIGDVNDFARLHPSEDEYWSCELCFVAIPIKGAKRDILHLIDDDLAVQYLHAKKIKRHRLALACKPHDVFFFCIVPSQNLDNAWNADALTACDKARTRWLQAMSRRSEGAEGYKIDFAQDQDAFPPPKWPSRSLDELLEVTFKDSNIDHDRHPGLLRLIGAKQDLT